MESADERKHMPFHIDLAQIAEPVLLGLCTQRVDYITKLVSKNSAGMLQMICIHLSKKSKIYEAAIQIFELFCIDYI